MKRKTIKIEIVLFVLCCLIGTHSSAIAQVSQARTMYVTLDSCRAMAVRYNKMLKVSEELVESAKWTKKEAISQFFPKISANATYMWNEKNLVLFDLGPISSGIAQAIQALDPSAQQLLAPLLKAGNTALGKFQNDLTWDVQNVFVGGVNLVQPIFMGLKIVSANQIAKYAEQAAQALHDQSLQNVIYSTDEIYWQVVSLSNKKTLAEIYVSLLDKMDSNMQALVEDGLATHSDGLAVKVKANEARITLSKVENGLSLSRMLLSQHCGISTSSPIILVDENLEPSTTQAIVDIPEDVNDSTLSTAFLQRGDLRALSYAEKMLKKKEAIVLSDMLPSIGLSANYVVSNPNMFNGFQNSFSGMFNIGLIARVPITDWIGGSFRKQASKSQTRMAHLQYEDAKEKVELQIKQSSFRWTEAEKKIATCEENLESAKENLESATYGFEQGVISSLNLMEAQTAWVSAQAALIDAQIELRLSQIYYHKALGDLSLKQ